MFPLGVLALLAILTFWIDRTVQSPEPKVDGSSRHDPDYILHNFTTSRTDSNGNLRYVLKAAEMKHYPDDDSTKLLSPHFTQFAIDKPYTRIEGDRGVVSSDGETIEFMDNVRVVRQAFKDRGEMTVTTSYLKLVPKTEVATTDKPVVITQEPKTVIYATGMVYDKKQKTVDLLSKVKVHYEKPANKVEARAELLKAPVLPQKATTQKSVANTNKKTVKPAGRVKTTLRKPQD